ncbi:hypothetical protein Ana3638_20870 [Anaerocolumna sedimenticola]|uniref:Uncharacterized protein n=1 Tax=Anaerocolumna sedimenticola TaxID=2696063 RepID=A0A6P1TRP4_9FIRM|nr:hypothetical protein [Anaerocolumna sedimenticola]QHQ62929.1 hypothetical protein Ana3638_20870 [Anaerocolumna sedimenticola]
MNSKDKKEKVINEIIPLEECVIAFKKFIKTHNIELISLNEAKSRYSKVEFTKIMDEYKIAQSDLYKYIKNKDKDKDKNKDKDEENYKHTRDYISKIYRKNDTHKPTKTVSKFLNDLILEKYNVVLKENINCEDAIKIKQVYRFSEIVDLLDKNLNKDTLIYLPNEYSLNILKKSSLDDILTAINQVDSEDEQINFYMDSSIAENAINEEFFINIEKLSDKTLQCIYEYYESFLLLDDYKWNIIKVLESLSKEKLEAIKNKILELKIPKMDIIDNAFEYCRLLNITLNEKQLNQVEKNDYIVFLSQELNYQEKSFLLEMWDIFSNINTDVWNVFCIIALSDTSKEYRISQAINNIFLNHGLII